MSADQLKTVSDYLDLGAHEGARVLAGGGRATELKVNQESAGVEFQVPFWWDAGELERLARAGQGGA